MRASIRSTLLMLVLTALASACDKGDEGDDGGGDFEPTTPPDDVCGLLTTADVAGAVPAPGPGMVVPTADTADTWARICEWYANGDELMPNLELVVQGPLTENGELGLQAAFDSLGPQREDIAGVGERAVYWIDPSFENYVGLYAVQDGLLVGTTSYFVVPQPTKEQLQPLVVKALGQL